MSTTLEPLISINCETGVDNYICGSDGNKYPDECSLRAYNSAHDEAVYRVNHAPISHFIYA